MVLQSHHRSSLNTNGRACMYEAKLAHCSGLYRTTVQALSCPPIDAKRDQSDEKVATGGYSSLRLCTSRRPLENRSFSPLIGFSLCLAEGREGLTRD
jgi:hypothetical protein